MSRDKTGIWSLAVALLIAIVLVAMGASSAKADLTFGKPINLTTVIPVIDPMYDNPLCFSPDGLEMYVAACRPESYGGWDLWVSRRDSIDADWPALTQLGPAINGPSGTNAPYISSDGLEIYFAGIRPEGYGDGDLYVSARATATEPWGEAVNLGSTINTSSWEGFCWVSPNGLELYFQSNRPGGLGGFDFYVSRRMTTKDPWGDPENLGPVVNSEYDEVGLCVSRDGLVLFFQDRGGSVPRPGGYGSTDLWMARRTSLSTPWGPPTNLGPNVNGPNLEFLPCLSLDGSLLYYGTETNGIYDNWQVPIIPTVDFNADKKVDLVDLVMLIDNWGSNKTHCDIGPMPWGDGKVDIEDLRVFMTYYEKEDPPAQP
jgi:hypothetical protein